MSSVMYKKLNKTLINDKKINTLELSKLLKFEFTKILYEFADVLPETILNIDIDDKGDYTLTFKTKLKRIKNFGVLQ